MSGSKSRSETLGIHFPDIRFSSVSSGVPHLKLACPRTLEDLIICSFSLVSCPTVKREGGRAQWQCRPTSKLSRLYSASLPSPPKSFSKAQSEDRTALENRIRHAAGIFFAYLRATQ